MVCATLSFEPVTLKLPLVSWDPVVGYWNASMHSGDRWESVYQCAYLTICGLAVTLTLTFDLLTSKSEQFIVVPTCAEIVNLVKSHMQTFGIMHRRTAGKQHASSTVLTNRGVARNLFWEGINFDQSALSHNDNSFFWKLGQSKYYKYNAPIG